MLHTRGCSPLSLDASPSLPPPLLPLHGTRVCMYSTLAKTRLTLTDRASPKYDALAFRMALTTLIKRDAHFTTSSRMINVKDYAIRDFIRTNSLDIREFGRSERTSHRRGEENSKVPRQTSRAPRATRRGVVVT